MQPALRVHQNQKDKLWLNRDEKTIAAPPGAARAVYGREDPTCLPLKKPFQTTDGRTPERKGASWKRLPQKPRPNKCHFIRRSIHNCSRGWNDQPALNDRAVSVYRVPHMQGFGHADVPVVLQVPGNAADAVPCKRLRQSSRMLTFMLS